MPDPARPSLLTTLARLLQGLVFTVMGLNGFLNFLPQPTTPFPQPAMAFMQGMMATGYMFPLVAGTQLVAGLLLLAGRFVPLALALLAPVVVNILAFHLFLKVPGLALALPVVLLELYLAWAHRAAYRSMLRSR